MLFASKSILVLRAASIVVMRTRNRRDEDRETSAGFDDLTLLPGRAEAHLCLRPPRQEGEVVGPDPVLSRILVQRSGFVFVNFVMSVLFPREGRGKKAGIFSRTANPCCLPQGRSDRTKTKRRAGGGLWDNVTVSSAFFSIDFLFY